MIHSTTTQTEEDSTRDYPGVAILPNETYLRWTRAEYGFHSDGGSYGPTPLPSEVGNTRDSLESETLHLHHATSPAHRRTRAICPVHHLQLPLTKICAECAV